MNKTDIGLLDNHVQAIKNAENDKSLNDVLLSTVELLMDNIKYSSEVLSLYDKIELRILFDSFGRVTQDACDFYQSAKKYLDPIALNGEIGRRLDATTSEISIKNESLEALDKNNAELLKEERALNEVSKKYKKREARVIELRQIKETVTPEVLEALEREAGELDEYIKINQKIKDELDSKISEHKIIQQSLKETIARVNEEKNEIEENIIQTINERIESLKDICANQSEDISRIQEEIESYVEQYSQFESEFAEIKALYSNYELHLGENSRISKELKKYGIRSIRRFSEDIRSLETTVGVELARYDEMIKNVVREQEIIKEGLISRSEPQAS